MGYASRLRPQRKSRRLPTTKRMPACLAATWARTTPARLLRSVSAKAARPKAEAAVASSWGWEAPRRKLKLLVTCSSAYAGAGAGMSGEEAMEIPPSRLSVEPEAAALLVFQPPVVAGAAGFAAPPFGGNAGRPIGATNAMAPRLPEEFLRWIARGLHALRSRQQAQGTRPGGPACRRARRRRQGALTLQGPLRQMAFPRDGARQTIEAQAIAQPIDEGRQFRRARRLPALQSKLQIGKRLDMRGGQRHRLDAEAGIDALQPLGEKTNERPIVARRPAGADAKLRHSPVDAIAEKFQAARALPRHRQIAAQPRQQTLKHGGKIVGIDDRLGQDLAHDMGWGGQARRDGFFAAAERLIQPLARQQAEAPGQRRT